MKLLLVDDDADLLDVTGFALEQAGFNVVQASTVAGAVKAFRRERPDLVLLDINLPDGLGFDACLAIRGESAVPVMMLTVRGEEEDLVRALELGADDYVTKPYSPRSLIARVKALLRRSGIEPSAPATAGQLRLDAAGLTLRIGESRAIRVTRLEFRFLQLLFAHPGETVRTDRMLVHVWGRNVSEDRQVLKQLVHRVRQKIGGADGHGFIETIPGVGYRLRTDAPE
jgi:DNA-binding response OmpR family regulator